jgi:hypothetical protein
MRNGSMAIVETTKIARAIHDSRYLVSPKSILYPSGSPFLLRSVVFRLTAGRRAIGLLICLVASVWYLIRKLQ